MHATAYQSVKTQVYSFKTLLLWLWCVCVCVRVDHRTASVRSTVLLLHSYMSLHAVRVRAKQSN